MMNPMDAFHKAAQDLRHAHATATTMAELRQTIQRAADDLERALLSEQGRRPALARTTQELPRLARVEPPKPKRPGIKEIRELLAKAEGKLELAEVVGREDLAAVYRAEVRTYSRWLGLRPCYEMEEE